MHPVEQKSVLDSMVILVDTREQDTPRLRLRLNKMECPYERQKLDFGDYSAKFRLPTGDWWSLAGRVAVERKMSLDELCQCYTRSRDRFTREFERAAGMGAKIYLLVENGSWEQAWDGEFRTRMTPQALVASMTAWLARYNCQLLFCEPKLSGPLIREVLYREAKELLESEAF